MEDNWIKFWLIVATTVISLIIAITFYQYSRDKLIVEMVKAGASPTEAAIAVGNTYNETALLLITQNKCGTK